MTSEGRLSRQAKAGQWLRDQRVRHGYATAAEFGRAVGVSKEVMSNYEVGRSAVPDDRAKQIADALHLDLIEVRRNLGLWVPDDTPPAPADDHAERLRELSERLQAIAEEMERLGVRRRDEDPRRSA